MNTTDQRVMLKTSLVREDLFAWLKGIDCNPVQVDTWTITDHPAPDGDTFTLYAMTVLVSRSESVGESVGDTPQRS